MRTKKTVSKTSTRKKSPRKPTQAGVLKARTRKATPIGRPRTLDDRVVRAAKRKGVTVNALAKRFGVTVGAIRTSLTR